MSKSKQVVPAILTDNPKTLETLVRQTEAITRNAQFDIMDGKFVPSRSINSEDIQRLTPKLDWEVHLMVLQPENYLEGFLKAGATKIVFHYEATSAPQKLIRQIKKLGLKAGIALNPETPISAIEPLVKDVDSVLFLSVNPGFYGAKFIPEVLDKIREFHKLYPDCEAGIDGGIKESNIAAIAQSGVDVIYVGSAIFLQPDPAASYKRLLALARCG
ncbi:MAG: ribulose-phosphate 3-epimerase [Dehalococcoidales bacterium]|nr:ribulose-phosphate 3-epimerase [Dehalococcoidales bacterium]